MRIKQTVLASVMLLGLVTIASSESPQVLGQTSQATYARLFWQDQSDQTLHWGDLQKTDGQWELKSNDIPSMPKLNPDQQSLVQMVLIDQHLVVGVRDEEHGNYQSGWVGLWSGCKEADHGSHSHWYRNADPVVVAQVLDDQQGNPAHVYDYQGTVVIANDQKNGVTIVDPRELGVQRPEAQQLGEFIRCGGQHITAAAIPGKVCYGTWIDRDGERKGQVDVAGLGSQKGKGYSFTLPSGGIHGATVWQDKVFFAPSEGICWVLVDPELKNREKVEIHQLSLGDDDQGQPRRTGAFASCGDWVLCTTGRGETAAELCLIDAVSESPSVVRFPLPVASQARVTTPCCIRNHDNQWMAIVFEEHEDREHPDRMHVIKLPATSDDEIACVASIPVGPNQIQGHSGHHQVVEVSSRYLAVCSPGDGSISVIQTKDWTVAGSVKVNGQPGHLVARPLN